jgi:tetratricopeptide (TPR) repeat protein
MKRFALSIALAAVSIVNYVPALAQSIPPEECLKKVLALKPLEPAMMEPAKAALHSLIPDPAAYEKTLPPLAKVISSKDSLNLKNYGGLSEAYLYSGNTSKGEGIFSQFSSHASEILGPNDSFSPGVVGDFALYYYFQNDFTKAEPLFLKATNALEKNQAPERMNNLVSDYMCLTFISNKKGNKAEAQKYAKKMVDLSLKIHKLQHPGE